MKLDDIILLAAMGPPGGGRSAITNRLVRHFNILAYPELDRGTVYQIYQKIVGSFYKRFADNIKEAIPKVVECVLDIYYQVKQELLPTPSKSHYTFNLRDITRVCSGLCSANPKGFNDIIMLVKLWYHENMRVYHDRLTTDVDREYCMNMLVSKF